MSSPLLTNTTRPVVALGAHCKTIGFSAGAVLDVEMNPEPNRKRYKVTANCARLKTCVCKIYIAAYKTNGKISLAARISRFTKAGGRLMRATRPPSAKQIGSPNAAALARQVVRVCELLLLLVVLLLLLKLAPLASFRL